MDNEAGGDAGAYWRDDEVAARRCRSLLSAIDSAVFEVDGDMTFTEVDDAFVTETGYDRSELVDAHVSKVFDEASTADLERELEAGVDPVTLDVTVATATGDRLAAELRASPVDGDGSERGAIGFVRTSTPESDSATEHGRSASAVPEAERRYRTLAEHFPNGAVVMFDTDLEITLAAGQGFEKVSFEPRDIEGRRIGDIFDDETAAAIEPIFQAALEGEQRSLEVSFEGAEWLLRAVPIAGPDGEVTAGMAMVVDVTERERMARRLEESERRYRTLVENFPNGAVGLFDEDLRYTAAGGRAFSDLDDSETEVVGETIWERYPEELAEKMEPRFEAALRGEASDFELAFHDRVWMSRTHPIEDEGEVSGGVIKVQDVTDRKERERELERSEQRYRTLVEHFPNGAVALVDEDLRYQMVGGTPPEWIDLATDQLVGERVHDVLPSGLAEDLAASYETAFRGESTAFEYDVGGFVYRFHTVPVRDDDGGVFAALGMSQDVTEQKAQERRLRDAKAQLEAATETANIEPVDLDDVLEDVTRDVQVRVEETDAEITSGSLPTVRGDPSQLRQVFQNLLSNTLEYSGEAPPQIHVDAERSGGEWVVSVADEGIGIEPDQHERVFEVFQRLHSRENHEGTGIGLTLTLRIVERHDGDIWVESAPDEGSTFYFTLPVEVERDG